MGESVLSRFVRIFEAFTPEEPALFAGRLPLHASVPSWPVFASRATRTALGMSIRMPSASLPRCVTAGVWSSPRCR